MEKGRPTTNIRNCQVYAGSAYFVRVTFSDAQSMPRHSHEGVASIGVCLRGIVRESVGRHGTLNKACLSFIPEGVPHANYFEAGTSLFVAVIDLPYISALRKSNPTLNSPFTATGAQVRQFATEVESEFLSADDLSDPSLEILLMELLDDFKGGLPERFGRPKWLQAVSDQLRSSFAEPLRVDRLAKAAGVHPSHLMRAFRETHGCTLGDFVRHQRVENAKHLLSRTETPLGDVAAECGFCDQSHFNRAFKRLSGESPRTFRRENASQPSIAKM